MLGKEAIKRELAALDLEVASPNELFEIQGAKFLELGYVNDTYLPTIKEREAEYPTALPVEPYPIAIPHTKASAIEVPFIAPVRLKNTVAWGDMSEPDQTLDVKIVCMLGFKDPGEHIELLQILMHNFQRPEWVAPLYDATTEDEFFDAFKSLEWTHD